MAPIVAQQALVAAKKKAPSKSVIDINEEIKNGDFAAQLLPVRLTKTALGALDKDDKRSNFGQLQPKRPAGNIKSHCEPCEFMLIDDPSGHKFTVHKG